MCTNLKLKTVLVPIWLIGVALPALAFSPIEMQKSLLDFATGPASRIEETALAQTLESAKVAGPAQRDTIEWTITLASFEYGLNPLIMKKLAMCESNFRQYNSRGEVLRGRHGEYGIYQFMPGTWKWMTEKMGFDGDIKNPHDQAKVTAWAVSNGYANHWTCARKGQVKTLIQAYNSQKLAERI